MAIPLFSQRPSIQITIVHVSTSPPFHPGRSVFPSPVGDTSFHNRPSFHVRGLSANPHSPLHIIVYLLARASNRVFHYLSILFAYFPPANTESSFAPLGCYPPGNDVSHHLERRYPFLIAHTNSCAEPISSLRLRFLFQSVFAGCC